ncbi:hypothetical protein BN7_6194 [Wickerhamomyces ciferrii]|uniref:Protein kinase domain-containing protein n=1 Tax=Wickerhamomyces ciferrii (strain ATCC 14091 / BCRC 22168 / CBS 111 / JCM 3599 / NBRC 0793 / NRRL Y-1031 F-60-10) TaxID=1206466 RepID=K0KMU5_WICCF|nr:uncharacterized protein BN7_6194 [Wickerhamomyces ciferrii]CCH46600.1 hypothetical protein BN7_6194 [Wickerhamomyces ciferrii]
MDSRRIPKEIPEQVPLELPKQRRSQKHQLNYTQKINNNTSKIPIKDRQVSTPIEIIDDKVYGSVKKSSIPRITSSPLHSGSIINEGSTPIIQNYNTPQKFNSNTPPSTITKLSNQLSSLTLDTPLKPRNSNPNNSLSSKIGPQGISPISLYTSSTTTSTNSTPITNHKMETHSPGIGKTINSTPSPQQLGNRTSLLLKKRLEASSSPVKNKIKSSPIKRNSSFEPKLKSYSTRSISLDHTNHLKSNNVSNNTSKNPLKNSSNLSPLKENSKSNSSNLFSRLTRSTASADLKANNNSNKLSKSTTYSNLSQNNSNPKNLNKIRSVSNQKFNGYSRYPSINNQQEQISSQENKENQKLFIRKRQDSIPKIPNNFRKSFSVNTDLNHINQPQNEFKNQLKPPLTTSKRIISSRKPQLTNKPPIFKRISTIQELSNCLYNFDKTKNLLMNNNDQITKNSSIIDFNSLSSYEKAELSKIGKVYYINKSKTSKPLIRSKIPILTNSSFNKNFGFDDLDKNLILDKNDHLQYRYQILGSLGKGSFGNVVKCFDHKSGKILSIKIMKNDLELSLQCINEIKVLKKLIPNKQSLNYFGHFNFRSHICIITELLSVNLYDCLESTNFKSFELNILQKWSKDILQGLKFLHQQGIIHADLKPENIMLISTNSLDLKIIDFGTSCSIGDVSYPYIQSRFYRSPEIVLGCRYNEKIDIWSFAVMIWELYMGNPMFPAKDELDLLNLIIKTMGSPDSRLILRYRYELNKFGSVNKRKNLKFIDLKALIFTKFDDDGNFIDYDNIINDNTKIKAPFLTKHETFNDFLMKALNWDIEERYSADELLNHDFLQLNL